MYRLKLAPTLNLIIFLLCVIISEITDLYYIMNKVIGSGVFYFFKYFEENFEYNNIFPEGAYTQFDMTRDRYYIFRYFFFALQFIRLWIFKESYLFLIFHLFIIYYFLYDLHLFFTYSYLLTVTNK